MNLGRHRQVGIALGAMALLVVGCGRLGHPVPPEYVGVGPLLERERVKEEQAKRKEDEDRTFTAEEAEEETVPTVEDVTLPPLQPVGTR